MEQDQPHEGCQGEGDGGHEQHAVLGAQQRLRIVQHYTKVLTGLTDMLVVVRSNHSLVVVQGRLVVIGGYQNTQTTSKVEVLDMSLSPWEEVLEDVY